MYSAQDLLDRFTHEGGLVGVLQGGVRAKEVPSEIEDEWDQAREAWAELQELEAAIVARLELSAIDAQDEAWEDEWDNDDLSSDDDL